MKKWTQPTINHQLSAVKVHVSRSISDSAALAAAAGFAAATAGFAAATATLATAATAAALAAAATPAAAPATAAPRLAAATALPTAPAAAATAATRAHEAEHVDEEEQLSRHHDGKEDEDDHACGDLAGPGQKGATALLLAAPGGLALGMLASLQGHRVCVCIYMCVCGGG